MEAWKSIWRKAIYELSDDVGLIALRTILASDSSQIIQGATTQPPPLQAVADWPVEASDALTFLFWKGEEGVTVGQAEEAFAIACFKIDQIMGEPAACRHFLNWYDETPRQEMIEKLLTEIDLAICRKKDEGKW